MSHNNKVHIPGKGIFYYRPSVLKGNFFIAREVVSPARLCTLISRET